MCTCIKMVQSNWFYGWCFQSCETSLRRPGLLVIEHSVWILYWYSKIVQSEYFVLWYIVVIGRLSSMRTNIVLESFLTVKFGLLHLPLSGWINVLSIRLRCTNSDYPFDIFQLFLMTIYDDMLITKWCKSINWLQLHNSLPFQSKPDQTLRSKNFRVRCLCSYSINDQ
jgi:hypothetical protein